MGFSVVRAAKNRSFLGIVELDLRVLVRRRMGWVGSSGMVYLVYLGVVLSVLRMGYSGFFLVLCLVLLSIVVPWSSLH